MGQISSILLIDDDNIFNFLNKKIIEKGNFARNVSSYSNPEKALDGLRQLWNSNTEEFPEIIFLDINMHAMDAWEFLEEFEKFPESALTKCKVFMLTSSIDQSDIEKSKSYKTVKDFISKPLSPEVLEMLSSSGTVSEKKEPFIVL